MYYKIMFNTRFSLNYVIIKIVKKTILDVLYSNNLDNKKAGNIYSITYLHKLYPTILGNYPKMLTTGYVAPC